MLTWAAATDSWKFLSVDYLQPTFHSQSHIPFVNGEGIGVGELLLEGGR